MASAPSRAHLSRDHLYVPLQGFLLACVLVPLRAFPTAYCPPEPDRDHLKVEVPTGAEHHKVRGEEQPSLGSSLDSHPAAQQRCWAASLSPCECSLSEAFPAWPLALYPRAPFVHPFLQFQK